MPFQRSKQLPTLTILIVVFSYAIIRYNVIKGVAWEELPLFISNKAISLSAITFIAISYALGSLSRFWPKLFEPTLPLRKHFGLLGFGLAALHAIFSFLLFSPAYYPKFFQETGKLTLVGELSMLFGVLAFFVFSLVAYVSVPAVAKDMDPKRWGRVQHFGYTGCVLILFHVAIMGIEGWTKPEGWPGGLLPISLMAAIIIALMLLLKISTVVFSRFQK